MASWKWTTAVAAAALSVAPAAAANSDVSIYSMATVPSWQMPFELVFKVSVPGADIVPQRYSVVPLTTDIGLYQSDQTIDIKADFALATETSYVNIAGSNKIAFLCCDNITDSFIDANTMFHALMDQLPAAILLYSEVGNCCGLSNIMSLPYQNILTMVDMGDASQTVNITQASANVVRAEIIGNATEANSGGADNPGGVNNSAIAMSILYSITGLVTVLFLVIIATGAVRAHRNPERYGPRSGVSGRPRQSRAKGIARAVLETLPIVKFGDPTPAKPDPSMELESAPDSRLDVAMGRNPSEVQVHHLSTIPEDAIAASKVRNVPDTPANGLGADAKVEAAPKEPVSGIGEASGAPVSRDSSSAENADHLGCSICTEDFSVGEDVRVLPCDHKFHPHCVDPWLVNVSGTCPLW
ncbi:ring-7 protein [Ophiostoma piceae UAMH 11346]|uniref:Ring-7 protein n=1 Tax=Ophiostoma piceae (strain UAMH 11346) TaxID=1262450 RepID=S3C5K4_OPHP1|nr:ring-7 protein [Ophiostoma piceae UAMH 11346]